MIRFSQVSKRYPNGYEALNSVSLTVEDGVVAAIIGRSGAGKSTLLRCINGLERATAGELRIDGGAATNNTLVQFQADILGRRVKRPKTVETTALGAAYLAGLSAGVWKNLREIESQWAVDREFEPELEIRE